MQVLVAASGYLVVTGGFYTFDDGLLMVSNGIMGYSFWANYNNKGLVESRYFLSKQIEGKGNVYVSTAIAFEEC